LVGERAEYRYRGDRTHPFEEFDITKLGSHSFKRSAVTLLKEFCASTAVVAAVSGTSASTLDTTYDEATTHRQRRAVDASLGPVFSAVAASSGVQQRHRDPD
jgi:hypothetical protein